MTSVIPLTPLDLALAGLLVLALAGLSLPLELGVAKQLLIAAARTCIQLLLVGLVLAWVFDLATLWSVALIALVMLGVAAREVVARQHRPFRGLWGFGTGAASMFVSSFTLMVLALTIVIRPAPWYEPQYAIPMLGMLLGNTMTGIALGMERLTDGAFRARDVLEQRLALGETSAEAIRDIRRDSVRAGLIPIMNAMAAAGIVSLPGMMTGQILAGSSPADAVRYQVLIMFLISSGTGFGTVMSVWLGAKRLFDDRERLRLDRLVAKGNGGAMR